MADSKTDTRSINLALLRIAAWSAPSLVYLVMVLCVADFTVDDAYISLRCAHNMVDGYGPVFNQGERVEVYTNALLVLIEALFIFAGLDALKWTAFLMACCGVALIVGVQLFARQLHESRQAVLWSGLLVASGPPLILWTPAGLETTMFAALVGGVVIAQVRSLASDPPGSTLPVLKGFLCLLLTLTRPDGALLFAAVFVFDVAAARRTRCRRSLIVFSAVFGVPFVIYLIWKWDYFGTVIPEPFHLKTPLAGLPETTLKGLLRFLSFCLVDCNVVWFVAITAGMRRGKTNDPKWFPPLPLLFAAFAAGLYSLYLISLGYHVTTDDALRYYTPLVPMLTLCALLSFPRGELRDDHFLRPAVAILLVCLLVVRFGDLYYMWNKDINLGFMRYCAGGRAVAAGIRSGHVAAGMWLRDNAQPNDTIMLHDSGAIPYFSKLRTIDTWSLSDRRVIAIKKSIARSREPAERESLIVQLKEYLIGTNPTYIVQDQCDLLNDPHVGKKYVRVGPDFTYLDPSYGKPTVSPFGCCKPQPGYIIRIWKRAD
ncbi:MAG: hypothetical protein V2B18_08430 [Pseudomonadota bacterium]